MVDVKQGGWTWRLINDALHLMLGRRSAQVNGQDQIVQSGHYCYSSIKVQSIDKIKIQPSKHYHSLVLSDKNIYFFFFTCCFYRPSLQRVFFSTHLKTQNDSAMILSRLEWVKIFLARSAGAVEYSDCVSADG